MGGGTPQYISGYLGCIGILEKNPPKKNLPPPSSHSPSHSPSHHYLTSSPPPIASLTLHTMDPNGGCLDYGPTVQRDYNLLHVACLNDDFSTIEVLLEKGTYDIHSTTQECGYTPLTIAAMFNFLRSARLLLSFGADVSLRDKKGRTALMRASLHGFQEMMELLLENGADLNAVDDDGHSSLDNVILSTNLGALRLLLSRGAEVNKRDGSGATPMHFACQVGEVEVIKMLVSAGGDPFPPCTPPGQDVSLVSPLGIAANKGNVNAVRFMTECVGMKVDVKIISHAIDGGSRACVKFLLSRYERRKQYNSHHEERHCHHKERAVVAHAVEKGMHREVQWLQEKGIDVTGCPMIVDVLSTMRPSTTEDKKRFKAMVFALARAPAARSVSWGWALAERGVKIKKTQTVIPWRRGSGRVVRSGLFRLVGKVDV